MQNQGQNLHYFAFFIGSAYYIIHILDDGIYTAKCFYKDVKVKGDLYENTRDLLLFNRRRSAEKAVQQAKKQRAVGMER